jgi:hypothetical protein
MSSINRAGRAEGHHAGRVSSINRPGRAEGHHAGRVSSINRAGLKAAALINGAIPRVFGPVN